MSGGSKNSSPTVATTPTAAVTPNVKVQTFGGILDPAIAQQLASAGLLGSMSNPSMFQPVNVPILNGPDDVRNYLLSQGKSYINNDGTTGGAANSGGNAQGNGALQGSFRSSPESPNTYLGRYLNRG